MFFRVCLLAALCAVFSFPKSLYAKGWPDAVKIPPIGTEVVFKYANPQHTWQNVDRLVGQTPEGLRIWESYGVLPDGGLAGTPWHRLLRDDQFRLVAKEKHHEGEWLRTTYRPHACGRTVGTCSYTWESEIGSGEGETIAVLEDGELIETIVRTTDRETNTTVYCARHNAYGMRVEWSEAYNGRVYYQLRLIEMRVPFN